MIEILRYLFYFIASTVSPLQLKWLTTHKNADNDGQINFAFQIMLILSAFSLFLPFIKPFYISGNIFYVIGLTLICGLSGAIYFIASYIAQKYVEAGITSLIFNIYTPVAIVLATFFLNEKLTLIQVLGTLFLLIGMLIVSKKHRIGRFKFDKYFMLMILSGVMMGILITAERGLQKMTGFTAATMFSWCTQCLFLGIATLITKNKSKYSKKDIAITGTLRFLQAFSWVTLLFSVGNLSFVSSISTFKVVIIFIAAAIFLKEREDLKIKIIGSFIALAGLLLMK